MLRLWARVNVSDTSQPNPDPQRNRLPSPSPSHSPSPVRLATIVGNKCNEYVCLVLHSPEPTKVGGGEREVKCDYIRIWSTVGTCANFHHKALHDIFKRYNAIIPGLRRLRIWSDGHGSTYKGRCGHAQAITKICSSHENTCPHRRTGFPNFGRMAYWPREKPEGGILPAAGEEDAESCEIFHFFFPSHHACGPQDNAGKDPRIGMERDIGYSTPKPHPHSNPNPNNP